MKRGNKNRLSIVLMFGILGFALLGSPSFALPSANLTDCIESWHCIEWTPCVSNIQIRNCNDDNHCGTIISKPEEQRVCVPGEANITNSGITGAVIGALGTSGIVLLVIFILAIIALVIMIIMRRKKK